ncbi:MAG: RagB/SusD family nutrient uptake outer membrane protein [Prevotellaceae bacterium]|nr:RagB/SusD family nutrient uptake outer membrane protein [Prevotellaceae bacterium]MDY3856745.1 RagB/SusD family nutrient uptake outer membrane protein [Bacteroidaceae bacterium]
MKKYNIYNKIILPGCLGVLGLLSSCSAFDDFLTVYPTNQITGEQFWEDKADLESGLFACYKQLTTTDFSRRLYVWGETRSDNVIARNTSNQNLVDLMNANLLPDNSWYDWSSIYKEIGFCNLALSKGPEVVAKDASLSQDDWLPMETELKTLRALSYFYLVRTFREVPLNLSSSDTDDGVRNPVPQSSAEAVLTYCINDLESCKDHGMTNYGNSVDNKGRITKDATYTLLADMYLWRAAKNSSADSVAKYPGEAQADYQKVIELCDAVIANKIAEYTREHETNYYGYSDASLTPLPLLLNVGQTDDISYNSLFGTKNSLESIFEIEFSSTGGYNKIVPYFMGYYVNGKYSNANAILQASAIFNEISDQPNDDADVFSKTDLRCFETFYRSDSWTSTSALSAIIKYVAGGVNTSESSDITNTSNCRVTYSSGRTEDYCDANWIVYRASDVLLMKAEAIACLYAEGAPELEEAFNLVKAVFDRSNPSITAIDEIKYEDYETPSALLDLIYKERQREFYGEGKRWFDLVRKAEREASTTNAVALLSSKFTSNSSSIKAKLATLPSLYSPIYRDEMKVNTALKQNPVWTSNETSSRN